MEFSDILLNKIQNNVCHHCKIFTVNNAKLKRCIIIVIILAINPEEILLTLL